MVKEYNRLPGSKDMSPEERKKAWKAAFSARNPTYAANFAHNWRIENHINHPDTLAEMRSDPHLKPKGLPPLPLASVAD